jgi:hypothetical protein
VGQGARRRCGESVLGVVAVGDSPRKALHGGSARLVGNGGAEPVVGSRWPENWSASSGVPWRSCCRGRQGRWTISEGCRREELSSQGTATAASILGGQAPARSTVRGRAQVHRSGGTGGAILAAGAWGP